MGLFNSFESKIAGCEKTEQSVTVIPLAKLVPEIRMIK